jgi:hypothetical protein
VAKCVKDALGNKEKIAKSSFIKSLNKESVLVLFRQNDEGRIYGISFVDNKTKVVFKGSDLGKAFGAKAITSRLSGISEDEPVTLQWDILQSLSRTDGEDLGISKTLEELIDAKPTDFVSPDSATRKRRKKRKKKGRSL